MRLYVNKHLVGEKKTYDKKKRLTLCTDQEEITQTTVQICEYLYVMDLILHL